MYTENGHYGFRILYNHNIEKFLTEWSGQTADPDQTAPRRAISLHCLYFPCICYCHYFVIHQSQKGQAQ